MATLNPSGNTALTAWKDATNACFNFLCSELDYKAGVAAFMGDVLPDTKAGVFAFIISGGAQQIQNYQSPTPPRHWQANGALLGQFITMDDGFRFGGKLMNIMPAYRNAQNPGQATPGEYMKGRGIAPNVCVFELTTHPEIFTRIIGQKQQKALWMIRADFRIVYNTTQT